MIIDHIKILLNKILQSTTSLCSTYVPNMEHMLFQHPYVMDSDCSRFKNEMSRLQIRNSNAS